MSILRVCDVIAFEPILGRLNLQESSISEDNFMRHAKLWRFNTNDSIAIDQCTNDARTNDLIDRVNALISDEPHLTFEEMTALLALLHEERNDMWAKWQSFCENMKYPSITFSLGLWYLYDWTFRSVPTTPLPAALNRLVYHLHVPVCLNIMYSQCAQQPLKDWPSIFEFYAAFVALFLKWGIDNSLITDACVKVGESESFSVPAKWNTENTAMLLSIKRRAIKIKKNLTL